MCNNTFNLYPRAVTREGQKENTLSNLKKKKNEIQIIMTFFFGKKNHHVKLRALPVIGQKGPTEKSHPEPFNMVQNFLVTYFKGFYYYPIRLM